MAKVGRQDPRSTVKFKDGVMALWRQGDPDAKWRFHRRAGWEVRRTVGTLATRGSMAFIHVKVLGFVYPLDDGGVEWTTNEVEATTGTAAGLSEAVGELTKLA